MHWLIGAASLLGTVVGWRWVIKPLRRGWRELMQLLLQIRDASGGVQKLAREIEALSGSFVHLATVLLHQQQEHESRLGDLGELYVDLVAVVARNRKRIDQLEGRTDDADSP